MGCGSSNAKNGAHRPQAQVLSKQKGQEAGASDKEDQTNGSKSQKPPVGSPKADHPNTESPGNTTKPITGATNVTNTNNGQNPNAANTDGQDVGTQKHEPNENNKAGNSKEHDVMPGDNSSKPTPKVKQAISLGQTEDFGAKTNKLTDGYEALFQDDKENNWEQHFCEMNELQLKKYEVFLESDKDFKDELPNIGGGSKAASSMMEWVKVLQKMSNYNDKSIVNSNESKGRLEKLYGMIVSLKARNWYEELVALYKEKNSGTKAMVNMSSLTFDRKVMMLQEHFRWLVASVANTKLNFNKVIGAREFPPIRKKNSSGSNSESDSAGFVPSNKSNNVIQGNAALKLNAINATYEFDSSSGNIYAKDLPEATSNVWVKGFIWKGVFFKVYSKKEAQALKREMRVLKHLAIEYLQTETCFKFVEGQGITVMNVAGGGVNESVSQDINKASNQSLQVILPLICSVESSSWILIGSPVFPRKKWGIEDSIFKFLQPDSSSIFKNSFLLSGADYRNFKLYQKSEEQNTVQQSHILSVSLVTQQAAPNFLLLTNVNRIVLTLPKVQVLFMIAQDESVNIMFTQFPKKGFLEYSQIKKMLGYSKYDISFANLKQTKDNAVGLNRDKKKDDAYAFELIKFKKRGWRFQMIYLNPKEKSKHFSVNYRATDLLAKSESKNIKEIRGNVLVFGHYSNSESIIHPYFISENYLQSISGDNPLDFNSNPSDISDTTRNRQVSKLDTKQLNINNLPAKNISKSSSLVDVTRRENVEKHFFEYYSHNLCKSIDLVCTELKKTDKIVNFNGIRDLFHRKGVNMRFAWLVYARVHRKSIKEILGVDILVRCIKKMLTSATSRKIKQFKSASVKKMEATTTLKKDESNDLQTEKSEFFTEEYFKKNLTFIANFLVVGASENASSDNYKNLYRLVTTTLFLSRLRTIDTALRYLDRAEFDYIMSAETLKEIVNYAFYNANIFFDAIQHHFSLSVNYELLRQLRNDKYAFILSPSIAQLKFTDLNIVFRCDPYLTIQEKCFIAYLRQHPNLANSSNKQMFIEYPLPPSLYKLYANNRTENSDYVPSYDCLLRDSYELPDLEILNDWVVLLEGMLSSIVTLNSEQNFLLEAYTLQIMLTFFLVSDDQSCSAILDKINTHMSCVSLCSPEMTIMVHTWYGILTETKNFVECEQSYMVALLTLHKLYGDPRARGGRGMPWELFITSRLSILSRLQGKTHDAEYVEELFDATLLGMNENKLNQFYGTNPVYSEPFLDFLPKEELQRLKEKTKSNLKASATLLSKEGTEFRWFERMEEKIIGSHPFVYWTHNMQYDENSFKIDVINQTLPRSPILLKWMIEYMPLNLGSGVLWEASYLKEFFLSIMQNAFSNSTSVSSLSEYSIGRHQSSGKDKISELGGGTPKSSSIKLEKKQKKFNQIGNLVQIFEKDASTLNKRESVGIVYAWGQNSEGQVGIPTNFIEDNDSPDAKAMRSYFPKTLLSLKDTVIVSVACGHTHSIATTISRRLLGWGNNKAGQLGLGKKAPAKIFTPMLIPDIEDVSQVSCGSEHTVALTAQGQVYSWGQGEGGLLGHGNTTSQPTPKKIDRLDGLSIISVVCGGLHTLAVTKQGQVYSWGRAEGGQLGLPADQMFYDSSTNDLYLTAPKRVKGALEGLMVIQVACGDAHSLALTSLGLVYGWGYTNSGQLGLGVSQDNYEPGVSKYNLQVPEPSFIEKLRPEKIVEIFAGSTFSLFMTEKKELYGCGLNDYSQIGIEKGVNKLSQADNMRGGANNTKSNEIAIPRKLDCLTSIPLLKVCCGENHSLALAFFEKAVEKYYILFTWGMQKHGQLGLGDISMNQFTPRPLTYLQDVMIYSMACGAYHSLVVLGDPTKFFKKDVFVERSKSKVLRGWNVLYVDSRQPFENIFESTLNDMEYTAPSDEGRIDNPKSIKKIL